MKNIIGVFLIFRINRFKEETFHNSKSLNYNNTIAKIAYDQYVVYLIISE